MISRIWYPHVAVLITGSTDHGLPPGTGTPGIPRPAPNRPPPFLFAFSQPANFAACARSTWAWILKNVAGCIPTRCDALIQALATVPDCAPRISGESVSAGYILREKPSKLTHEFVATHTAPEWVDIAQIERTYVAGSSKLSKYRLAPGGDHVHRPRWMSPDTREKSPLLRSEDQSSAIQEPAPMPAAWSAFQALSFSIRRKGAI